jgi:hypothetical protein
MSIEVLDPKQTDAALRSRARANVTLNTLADLLIPLVDTNSSVWAEDLDERTINMLRTKVGRRHLTLVARKVSRDGAVGHVLLVKSRAQ